MSGRIEDDVMSILGYQCETQAPNAHPTSEFITDRWMSPRREALAEYIRHRLAETWDAAYHARWNDDRSSHYTPNPFQEERP